MAVVTETLALGGKPTDALNGNVTLKVFKYFQKKHD